MKVKTGGDHHLILLDSSDSWDTAICEKMSCGSMPVAGTSSGVSWDLERVSDVPGVSTNNFLCGICGKAGGIS